MTTNGELVSVKLLPFIQLFIYFKKTIIFLNISACILTKNKQTTKKTKKTNKQTNKPIGNYHNNKKGGYKISLDSLKSTNTNTNNNNNKF